MKKQEGELHIRDLENKNVEFVYCFCRLVFDEK